jgi:AcrR family transcriptional regulator
MTRKPTPSARRQRLPPEVRRRQIVEAAAEMVLSQGHLPLALDRLALAAGVSKALLYAYFPTQHQLFNAVLERQFEDLRARGLEAAAARRDLRSAALDCARIYFTHVAEQGPVIHIVLRDAYMAHALDPGVAHLRDRIVRRLAKLARRHLRLEAKENLAAINMAITIPEEAGRLVYDGQLAPERGLLLCEELVTSSLDAFTPERTTGRRAPGR